MQISPKCCIASAPLSAAAFALKCKAAQFYVSTRKHLQKQRPKAATYLCRFAAKARFDNRPNPRRVFPKREGRSPPSLVAQGWGIFKGEGRSKLPSPLNGVLWILSFAKERKYPVGDKKKGEKKKASRRRQKRAQKATGRLLSQHLLYFALPINLNPAGLQHLRRHAVPLCQRPGKRAVIDAPAPAGRASLLQHRRRAAI